MKIIRIIFFLLFFQSLYSYNIYNGVLLKKESQNKILKMAYDIGSQYKAIDNHIFNDTICAILLTESSGGKFLVGDNYFSNGKEKPFLLKSLGAGQVKLETAIIVLRKYPSLFPNHLIYLHKKPFAYKKYYIYLQNISYYSDILRRYKYKKTKRAYKVRRWAKRELAYFKRKMKPYKEYYKLDLELAQLLLSDNRFNIKVALVHLITNYNEALKRKMPNPYFKAISRYNGGWHNKRYYKKVMKNMKLWRAIKYDNLNKR